MTQPTETQLHLDGTPAFDLNPTDAWPMPVAKPVAQPVAPKSQIDRITEPFKRWLEMMGRTQ